MGNFRFFRERILSAYRRYFYLPKVKILDKRNDYLEKYPDAWGYYEPEERRMYLLREHDCLAVRLHEYGHWINACIYFILEIVWEFLWWGLGIRSLFAKKK